MCTKPALNRICFKSIFLKIRSCYPTVKMFSKKTFINSQFNWLNTYSVHIHNRICQISYKRKKKERRKKNYICSWNHQLARLSNISSAQRRFEEISPTGSLLATDKKISVFHGQSFFFSFSRNPLGEIRTLFKLPFARALHFRNREQPNVRLLDLPFFRR